MKWFRKIFCRKEKQEAQPLRIEGIGPAPMTPEPDDAELAAQALLENMIEGAGSRSGLGRLLPNGRKDQGVKAKTPDKAQQPAALTSKLMLIRRDKIRAAHKSAHLRALRFVAYCEQMLSVKNPSKADEGMLANLQSGLFEHLNAVEREDGELKHRWQHCVATVTVGLLNNYTGNGE